MPLKPFWLPVYLYKNILSYHKLQSNGLLLIKCSFRLSNTAFPQMNRYSARKEVLTDSIMKFVMLQCTAKTIFARDEAFAGE